MLRVPFAALRPRVAAVFSLLCSSLLMAVYRPAAAQSAPVLLRVRPVAPDVFVPTLYGRTGRTSATNGLLVRTTQGILLIDTAWNPEQTRLLLRWVADSLHQRVRLAIVTHAEAASPAALAVLRENQIRVYSSAPTSRRWRLRYPQAAAGPTAALKPYTVIRAGRTRLELFFPGPGFSPDNVVAWLPRRKVLFGGELVREQRAAVLTPAAEADLKQWPATLRTLAARYRKARVVVPAHGIVGDFTLLAHTQTLLREAARRKPQTALNSRP